MGLCNDDDFALFPNIVAFCLVDLVQTMDFGFLCEYLTAKDSHHYEHLALV